MCCHQHQIITLESGSLLLVEEINACAAASKQSNAPV